jgi:hypothetical protein
LSARCSRVVAFPQEAIIRDPGCDKLMEEAMELGCDVVGGLPWYERLDRHVHEHVDFCLTALSMCAASRANPTARRCGFCANARRLSRGAEAWSPSAASQRDDRETLSGPT